MNENSKLKVNQLEYVNGTASHFRTTQQAHHSSGLSGLGTSNTVTGLSGPLPSARRDPSSIKRDYIKVQIQESSCSSGLTCLCASGSARA